MLQETLHYPSTPPPPKDGWNPDPKVCVSGVVK